MNLPRLFLVSALVLFALSACGSVRESLGLGRSPPDEFAVVDRPPLSMPPDFGLRPPQPGAPRPQEMNTNQRASETLFGMSAAKSDTSGDKSSAEQAILEASGATKADPNIRQIVDRENSEKVVGSEHLLEQLMWWKSDEKSGVVVDPSAEAARIKEAKDKGAPINQGATPIIERQKSGWLGL